jgi:hypothetical protein
MSPQARLGEASGAQVEESVAAQFRPCTFALHVYFASHEKKHYLSDALSSLLSFTRFSTTLMNGSEYRCSASGLPPLTHATRPNLTISYRPRYPA